MGCSTTELRQHRGRRQRISDQRPDVEPSGLGLPVCRARLIDKAMTSGQKGQKGGQSGDRKGDAARAERLRAALRENLKRRKAQARTAGTQAGAARPTIPPELCRTSPRIRPIILRSGGQGRGMDRIRIVGGRPLNGTIPISGAKNATLPLMIASLLTDETLILDNVPRLADVSLLQRILGNHGVDIMVPGKRAGRRSPAAARPCTSRPRASSTPPRPTSSSPRCARASG